MWDECPSEAYYVQLVFSVLGSCPTKVCHLVVALLRDPWKYGTL